MLTNSDIELVLTSKGFQFGHLYMLSDSCTTHEVLIMMNLSNISQPSFFNHTA